MKSITELDDATLGKALRESLTHPNSGRVLEPFEIDSFADTIRKGLRYEHIIVTILHNLASVLRKAAKE